MNDVKRFCPKDQNDWRKWLELNHEKEAAVWLIFYKKKSSQANLDWSGAVNEALCFGWIDSVKRPIDNEKYIQYFSKRKANSTWSKINKDKVDWLISENLMKEAGFKTIAIAKKNGAWSILDEVEALIIPEDLKKALDKSADAMAYFERLSKSARKILLAWVVLAKKTDTRQKRIAEIAENASRKLKPKQFR